MILCNKKFTASEKEYIILNSFFWRRYFTPKVVKYFCQKNSFKIIYSHTHAVTYITPTNRTAYVVITTTLISGGGFPATWAVEQNK